MLWMKEASGRGSQSSLSPGPREMGGQGWVGPPDHYQPNKCLPSARPHGLQYWTPLLSRSRGSRSPPTTVGGGQGMGHSANSLSAWPAAGPFLSGQWGRLWPLQEGWPILLPQGPEHLRGRVLDAEAELGVLGHREAPGREDQGGREDVCGFLQDQDQLSRAEGRGCIQEYITIAVKLGAREISQGVDMYLVV